jgi:hypothetical protein
MPSLGFEPATPATKRPQTYALDRSAMGSAISKPMKALNELKVKFQTKLQVIKVTGYNT